MDATRRWRELLQRPGDDVPLDEAALLIAAHANPALDVAAGLRHLDSIAGQVRRSDTAAVCQVLFDDIGLRGDRENYDDPRNSYVDQVLARRLGIPISLSVLLIEIGRRCGVRLEGVGLPGHFLVRDPAAPEILIDAFDGGRRLDRDECEHLLRKVTGSQRELTQAMLATTGRRAILARMLANLDRSFERRGDTRSLDWVCTLRLHIPDLPGGDRLQLASRLGSLGRFDDAAGVLEDLAGDQPATDISSRLQSEATGLRARLN
jgi:regulator of sirC expression with transglutaminase-like and TPR domain